MFGTVMTVFVRLSYPCFVSLLIVPHLGISFYTPINLVLSDQQSHLQLMRFTSLHKLGDRCLLATGWTNAIVFFVLLRYMDSDCPFGTYLQSLLPTQGMQTGLCKTIKFMRGIIMKIFRPFCVFCMRSNFYLTTSTIRSGMMSSMITLVFKQ